MSATDSLAPRSAMADENSLHLTFPPFGSLESIHSDKCGEELMRPGEIVDHNHKYSAKDQNHPLNILVRMKLLFRIFKMFPSHLDSDCSPQLSFTKT